MQSAETFGKSIGVQAACAALIVPRSSLYRARTPQAVRSSPKISVRALSQVEKIKVREELNSERFQDRSPREVYATLIDEGRYLCSWRSMYRILDENDEVRERRNQLRHPNYVKPELLATAPNQLWSWDTPALACGASVTKLLGLSKWTYFYLYVILDVYSRYVVGWMIAEREIGCAGGRTDLANLCPAGNPAWTTHCPCRSWQCDDFQTGGAVAGGSRCHEDTFPPACLQ